MIRYMILGLLTITGIGAYSLMHPDSRLAGEKTDDRKTQSDFRWRQTDNFLALHNGGEIVWRLNYDKNEDKPYFYPLRTLDGIDLALERPEDHPWHRGLWFSWKYINGINYWEEDPELGLSEGRSLIKKVNVKKGNDYSATVELHIHYAPGEAQPPLLSEKRTLNISSPDENGNYYIDWHHVFSAQEKDITLDRTPPKEHIWGGYAGISYRASLDDLNSFRYLDSNGWTRTESLTGYGKRARWMDLSGKVKKTKSPGRAAGLAIFDHPDNPRHPSPWYVWYSTQGDEDEYQHAFFTPAFLYNKSFELSIGESFPLKYRTMIHKGVGSSDWLNSEYQDFIQ